MAKITEQSTRRTRADHSSRTQKKLRKRQDFMENVLLQNDLVCNGAQNLQTQGLRFHKIPMHGTNLKFGVSCSDIQGGFVLQIQIRIGRPIDNKYPQLTARSGDLVISP